MPYITPEQRAALDAGDLPEDVGELTYALTSDVIAYLGGRHMCYATFAEVLAALDATSKEFYRRVVAPYEDSKIEANGDVYPPELLSGQ